MTIIYIIGKKFFEKYNILRPILRFGGKFITPRFSGWGMTSKHYLPWEDDSKFLRTFEKAKDLDFTLEMHITPKMLDEYRWRLWNLVFCARMAPKKRGEYIC
jgi:hypothetical protein